MKQRISITLLLTLIAFQSLTAQTITCQNFCITDIRMDTANPNTMIFTMFFSGSSSDFINYPYFSYMINANADTVGTSGMNAFGQFGNTSHEYSMSTTLDSVPNPFLDTLYFQYDTTFCLLTFPCSTAFRLNDSKARVTVYPNPSPGNFRIAFQGIPETTYSLAVYSPLGVCMLRSTEREAHSTINLTGFAAGLYLLQLDFGGRQQTVKVWLE